MTTKQLKDDIYRLIHNGYAETHVGFHAEYRFWNREWRRGAYAQIAAPYGGTKRIYERSYAELLTTLLEERAAAREQERIERQPVPSQ